MGRVVEVVTFVIEVVDGHLPRHCLAVVIEIFAIDFHIPCRSLEIEAVVVCYKDIVVVGYTEVVVHNIGIVEEHRHRLGEIEFRFECCKLEVHMNMMKYE